MRKTLRSKDSVTRLEAVLVVVVIVVAAVAGYFMLVPPAPAETETVTLTTGTTGTVTATETVAVEELKVMWGEPDPFVLELFAREFSDFEERTGIKVTIVPVGGSGRAYSDKITTLALANDLPDIFFADMGMPIFDWSEQGWLEPVEDIIDYIESEVGPMWPLCKQFPTWKGHTWMVNIDGNAQFFWYRMDLAEQAGVTNYPPDDWSDWSWEEHIEMLEKFDAIGWTAAGYEDWSLSSQWIIFHFLSLGGQFVDKEGNIILDQPENRQIMEASLQVLLDQQPYQPLPGWEVLGGSQIRAMYAANRTASVITGGRLFQKLMRDAPGMVPSMGAGPLPAKLKKTDENVGPMRGAWAYPTWEGFCVSAQHPEKVPAAKELLKFFFDSDYYIEFLHQAPYFYFPTVSTIVDDPRFLDFDWFEKYPEIVGFDPMPKFVEGFTNAAFHQANPYGGEGTFIPWYQVYYGPPGLDGMWQKVKTGEWTKTEAVDWFIEQMRDAKAAYEG